LLNVDDAMPRADAGKAPVAARCASVTWGRRGKPLVRLDGGGKPALPGWRDVGIGEQVLVGFDVRPTSGEPGYRLIWVLPAAANHFIFTMI